MARENSLLPPRWIIATTVLIVSLWLILQLREIVTLIIVGYCLAYVLNPIVTILEEKKISRTVGTLFTFFVVILVVVAIIAIAGPILVREYHHMVSKLPEYSERISQYISPYFNQVLGLLGLPRLDFDKEGLSSLMKYVDVGSFRNIADTTFKALLKGYSVTLTVINFFLLPFITFYLCVDFKSIHKKGLEIFPPRYRSKVSRITNEIDYYVSAFLKGQLLVGLVLVVLYGLGLGFIGVDLWFLLALISGFGNIVPYLGFIIGIVLSSLMALVTFGSFTYVLYVWLVFVVVQGLEGIIITPRIQGDKVGISPLVIILAVLAGGKLFGVLGVFLAVPITAALRVLFKYFHQSMLSKSMSKITV